MGAATGGDITEISFNHPTIGSAILYCKASEDNTFDLGGFRSDDDDDGVDGGGNMIDKINRKRWSVDIANMTNDMNDRQDVEKINLLAASPVLADWTFSHINGTVYGGKGKPVGDIKNNVNASTFPLKIAGGGKLQRI